MSTLFLYSHSSYGRYDNPQFDGTTEECKRFAQAHLKNYAPEFHPLAIVKWEEATGDWLMGALENAQALGSREFIFAIKQTKPEDKMTEKKKELFNLTIKVKELDGVAEIKTPKSLGSYSVFVDFVNFDLIDGVFAIPRENVVWFKTEKIEQ